MNSGCKQLAQAAVSISMPVKELQPSMTIDKSHVLKFAQTGCIKKKNNVESCVLFKKDLHLKKIIKCTKI